MTDYTKITDFAVKDGMALGNPLKVIKGTEISTELVNVQTAINSKANLASPTFTGTVTIPTLNVSGNAAVSGSFTASLTGNASTATKLKTTGFEVFESGNTLNFQYGGIVVQSLDSSGIFSNAATGQISFFAMSSPPTGWLRANGAEVSRTVYWRLFAKIGVYYGAGDGSTTFNLPDARGYFIRALSDGVSLDSGRSLGSKQNDQSVTLQDGGYTVYDVQYNAPGYLASPQNGAEGHGVVYRILGTPRYVSGYDTRPYNIAFLACIQY